MRRAGGVALEQLGLYRPPQRRVAHADEAAEAAAADGDNGIDGAAGSSAASSSLQLSRRQPNLGPSCSGSTSRQGQGTEVVDWGQSLLAAWDISERGGLQLLTQFLTQRLSSYESSRSYADGRAVSRLSPYLHWGQLSVRLMWQRMRVAK